MTIEKTSALRGPNVWSKKTVLEVDVLLEEEEEDAWSIPGLYERLQHILPSVADSLSHQKPWSLAQLMVEVALRLQADAGCQVSFCRSGPTVAPKRHLIAVEYSEEAVGRLAIEEAFAFCNALKRDGHYDWSAAVLRIRTLDEEVRLGPSTRSIVQAAVERDIPFMRLNEASLIQFGWGACRRLIQAAETDRTSAIAETIAQDKYLTKRFLKAIGVPTPDGRPVTDEEDARNAALEIGFPVTVKPRRGNQGRGVTTGIHDENELRTAYRLARAIEDEVMVERHVVGDDYRLLVIGGQMVAAARRDPPEVVGDGVHTIRELVEIVNSDPRRSDGHATSLSRIRLDDTAITFLARNGQSPETIPLPGEKVRLRGNANLSTGGTATDVTDRVHPEVALAAIEAANVVGLDVCGVDVVCTDIESPLTTQNGAVIEVNAAPGLRMHLDPSFGRPRQVGRCIIDMLFKPGETGRIPLVTVTGTNGKTTTTRLIAHILSHYGLTVGMTCSDGIYIGGRRIEIGDCSGPKSARAVLQNPLVEAAVLESARGGILREGLAFDKADVGVVTNIGTGDHLGLNYLRTVEELTVLKRVVVENVSANGYAVLNANDPRVAAMASRCCGKVIFFAYDYNTAVLKEHLNKGGRGLFIAGTDIIAREGRFEYRIPLSSIPLTRNGTLRFQVENVLAATGAAWGLGIKWETIREALGAFISDHATVPGRFNVFTYHDALPAPGGASAPATVIADYGHNPDAIKALIEAVETFPARRRIAMLSGAGDRRDCDLMTMARDLGDAFDEIVLYEDACNRGRKEGEVISILRKGLEQASRVSEVVEIKGEFRAIEESFRRLHSGDLALLLIDQVEEALAFIEGVITHVPRQAA